MKRRSFISQLILGAVGSALGASLTGLSSCSKRRDRKLALALIGCGSRGTDVAVGMCKSDVNVMLRYVCDVDTSKAAKAVNIISKGFGYTPIPLRDMKEIYSDEEIDAVIIATPDHWHALATIMACKAGKDVYVETTMSHSIQEGIKIQEAAKSHKRIVQAGFQNRSAVHAISAREYIKSGKLGQIIHVKVTNLTGGSKWLKSEATAAPDGLDWNRWIGPAPSMEYSTGITEDRGWRNYWAFGGGDLAAETSHLLDLARMVLGDPGHPSSVYCSGGNWCWGSEKEVPENQVVTYDYSKYAMTCETGNAMSYMKGSDWMHVPSKVEIYGTEGLMYLGLAERGWQVIGPEGKIIFTEAGTKPDQVHFRNFVDCIRSRKAPACDALQGHLSSTLVHMGNIAYRAGNKQLAFNAEKELFQDNQKANDLLKPVFRDGFVIPEKV